MTRIRDEEADGDADGTLLLNGVPFTGEVAAFWSDDTMQSLTTYENGVEHGPYLEWHPNGALRVQGRSDLLHGAVGTWREWDENGGLVSEKVFGEDGELAAVRRWDGDGNLLEEKVFRSA
ncbi:hypothetical protein SUDANB121_00989 [Nocardiopsis dassonvillei]|uniref:toxin-antitoxin system YwqK family antitoxin n=1 Tax=Nocardiopsis dassonvillei TaxID=2014 RepID=UPI003F574C82